MVHFLIGIAFLMVLLIPIGFFMIGLVYHTVDETRKNSKFNDNRKRIPKIKQIPIREHIRVVK